MACQQKLVVDNWFLFGLERNTEHNIESTRAKVIWNRFCFIDTSDHLSLKMLTCQIFHPKPICCRVNRLQADGINWMDMHRFVWSHLTWKSFSRCTRSKTIMEIEVTPTRKQSCRYYSREECFSRQLVPFRDKKSLTSSNQISTIFSINLWW